MTFGLATGSHRLLACCSHPLTRGRGTVFLPKPGSPVPLLCSGRFVVLCTDTIATLFHGGVGWVLLEPKPQELHCSLPWGPALGDTCKDSGLKGDWLVVVGPEGRQGAGQPVAVLTARTASLPVALALEGMVESRNVAVLSNQSTTVLRHCRVVIPTGHHPLLTLTLEIFCCCFT